MRAAARYRILAMVVALLLPASGVGAAQLSGSLSGPVLGYLFDRNAGKLRALRGILGSATVGTLVESDFTVSQVLVLDATHVIASADARPELLALNLSTPTDAVPIPGVAANPSRAAASSRGTAAAFYYSGAHQVRIVTGLPEEPRDAGFLEVEQPLTQLAVSDDGGLLVYAVVEGEGQAVYGWTALAGSARFLTSAVSVSGLALTSNGDALVTDRRTNEVFAIWNAAFGAVRRLLAGAPEGVSDPVGVAVSSRNRIYVANAGSSTVMVLDSDGHFLKSQKCSCNLSGIHLLRDSVFRLTDGITRTLYLLDARTTEERIVFVPPPQDPI